MTERDLLARLIQGPASGAAMARAAGQTRAAIWKQVEALRAAGVAIDVHPGRGYALAHPLELLDADAILTQLPDDCRMQVAALEVAWSLDSTNSELLRRPTPGTGAAILLAERQDGGRGRRGRTWTSPLASNVYLSLARMFSGGLARLPGLSLVAGVATADALHALGYTVVRLKWPNDLVVVVEGMQADGIQVDGIQVDGSADANTPLALRKLGGLLVEGGGEVAGPARAVIGLGLNVAMPAAAATGIEQPAINQPAINQPWIDLATLDPDQAPSRNRLAATLLTHWLPALAQFDAQGLAPFLPRYRELDALDGRDVVLHDDTGSRNARVLGLAEDGALQVLVDGREQRVLAGEVSVRAS